MTRAEANRHLARFEEEILPRLIADSPPDGPDFFDGLAMETEFLRESDQADYSYERIMQMLRAAGIAVDP